MLLHLNVQEILLATSTLVHQFNCQAIVRFWLQVVQQQDTHCQPIQLFGYDWYVNDTIKKVTSSMDCCSGYLLYTCCDRRVSIRTISSDRST
ncbi:hypothetical protein FGO68_gene15956 [Halteria grandinella]|uniref:Uncharacterized protein n=1 Tax=Halteria grandinella TaxID=5974 RepID=A0A8J8N956_HALGN|nr:hypothetical protein FGO68_gene15956 [Halteria grandinella]